MSNCGKVDHCCWFQGNICKYLIESDHPDFKWACSLKETYGSWEAAHASDEYIKDVKELMNAVAPGGMDCGDYPELGTCKTCGE